jgi:hypothetical protein
MKVFNAFLPDPSADRSSTNEQVLSAEPLTWSEKTSLIEGA